MQENYIGAAEDYDAAVQAGSFRPESLFAAAQCYYCLLYTSRCV